MTTLCVDTNGDGTADVLLHSAANTSFKPDAGVYSTNLKAATHFAGILKNLTPSQRGFFVGTAAVTMAPRGVVTEDSAEFMTILLPKNSHIVKLLQRIRDESHRFAVSYHSVLKRSRQTSSLLDDIPGVGVATRKKLLRSFGSMRAVGAASELEIASIIGPAKAAQLVPYLVENYSKVKKVTI